MTGKWRSGCLWALGAWIWFGLVLALADMSGNDPTNQFTQAVFGIVLLAPFIVLARAFTNWRGRRARRSTDR